MMMFTHSNGCFICQYRKNITHLSEQERLISIKSSDIYLVYTPPVWNVIVRFYCRICRGGLSV